MNEEYDFMEDSPKPRSTSKWIVIIASGVLIGNILSFASYEAYTFLKWKYILETATTELKQYSSELKLLDERNKELEVIAMMNHANKKDIKELKYANKHGLVEKIGRLYSDI